MKIAVLSQAQGNFDAAREALELVNDCQTIIHLGDAIGLGPDPKETLELFLAREVICLRGLYEERVLAEKQSEHSEWLLEELGPELLEIIGQFAYRHQEEALPNTSFIYWPRNWRSFLLPPASPAQKELERIFKSEKEGQIFFGRRRETLNEQVGNKHLLSPGSLGANELSLVQGMVVDLLPGEIRIEERSAFYDPSPVMARMREKSVPGF